MTKADVVIVGGGIQGATMALAAARYGRRPLIIEKQDLASGATGNSYRIIHGGLRYLQTLNLFRWQRSRRAQKWFLDRYPQLVRPLPCIMPLYRRTLRNHASFRAAGLLDSGLARTLGPDLPFGRVTMIDPASVAATYPVPKGGLTGAARWYDLDLVNAKDLVTAILGDAGLGGEDVLTGWEAQRLVTRGGEVTGLEIRSFGEATTNVVETATVIDCSGASASPWFMPKGEDVGVILAFNLLLEFPFPDGVALAVSERPGRGRSYFLRAMDGGTFAGTYYRPAPGQREPIVTPEDIGSFLDALARAVPEMDLGRARIRSVHAGLLPAKHGRGMKLQEKDRVVLHSPRGFHRLLGGKLTTAPLLSLRVAERLWGTGRPE